MKNIVLVTGGFDPLHSGHIAYFKAARKLGDLLIVGLNSDAWLTRKKSRPFMPFNERQSIIENLNCVDQCILFNDDDGSAKEAINNVRMLYPNDHIVFANGGDRTNKNIPEMDIVDPNLTFVFGVGGEDKKNSSSWILTEWKAPKTQRQWGYYRVLHEVPGMKVKELTVDPGKKLSMQRHQHRAEYWIVSEGEALVHSMMDSGYMLPSRELELHDEYQVPVGAWHQLTNVSDKPCRIVEIQFGSECVEEDIERVDIA
jgi:cytidyltransferase-like protein